MQFYSTNHRSRQVSFREALLKGLADDHGLFMPVEIPSLPAKFFAQLRSLSLPEIAFIVAEKFINQDIANSALQKIVAESLNFAAPLIQLDDDLCVLELFHGPTLAFKDFAARFMAKTMSYFVQNAERELKVLVATSGDTGSAVANGFFNVPGIRVIILYPQGKVSRIQEQQLTTLDGNITALEIAGTFDDCQRLVKQAFSDNELNRTLFLTSANSINIARLIPQSFYYFHAVAQAPNPNLPVIFSVPSGNFGNLTGGLIAKKMGLPVAKFIAANNANDVFLNYWRTGIYQAKSTLTTLSNAMDVGNPSNFARVAELYQHHVSEIRQDIYAASFSDEQTKLAMKEIFDQYQYIVDPHTAVAYLGLIDYVRHYPGRYTKIFLATAHPAKFSEIVKEVIGSEVSMPERLHTCLNRPKQAIPLGKEYHDFKDFLLKL